MTPRYPALSILLGAALLVGAPLGWHLSQPPDAVGELQLQDAASADDDRDRPSRSQDVDGARATDETAPVDAEATAEPPVRVRIPAIGTDAPLDAVGLEPAGGMELPDDVARVGWYEPGVAPGQAGSAVLAGHVDSRTQGAGALFDLRELDVDDEIVTVTGDGEQRWRVVSRASYPKQALPIDELFSWEGPPRLVVITCGGAFDADQGAYEDNVVVQAVPW